MKKSVLAFCLATVIAVPATTFAQDIKVNPDLMNPDAGLSTTLEGVTFEKIPDVKNTQQTDARQQLKDFVAQVKSASGEFAQKTSGGKGKNRAAQTGTFSFERPGKFNWSVTKPYAQSVISDGKTVYQYDPDLRQVTERPVSKAVGASPAAILFGSGTLDDSFKLSALPDNQGMVWMRATPKVSDAGLSHVDIGFANNLPAELIILDSFGQTTSIKLRNFKRNAKIPASAYQFKAPAGVDTVKM